MKIDSCKRSTHVLILFKLNELELIELTQMLAINIFKKQEKKIFLK